MAQRCEDSCARVRACKGTPSISVITSVKREEQSKVNDPANVDVSRRTNIEEADAPSLLMFLKSEEQSKVNGHANVDVSRRTNIKADTPLEAVRESLAKLIVDPPNVDGHSDTKTLRTNIEPDTPLEAVRESLAKLTVDRPNGNHAGIETWRTTQAAVDIPLEAVGK
eukprot:7922504-Ditylum_brightwellii.AAC.1